jgi:hypothetical protein
MKSANSDLRELFQASVEAKTKGTEKRCPTLKALTASFEPGASARRKRKIIDHLSECPTCREDFRLYFDLRKFPLEDHLFGASRPAGSTHEARRQPTLRARFAAVVMGACLITSAVIMLLNDAKILETERAGVSGIVLLSPGSSVSGFEELVFRWESFDHATYYIVEVFDEDLLPVWISPHVEDIQVRGPSEQGLEMRRGGAYFWMVTAYSEDTKIGESHLARFRIAEKQ